LLSAVPEKDPFRDGIELKRNQRVGFPEYLSQNLGMMIGYARVSTTDQNLAFNLTLLRQLAASVYSLMKG
jgi:hypothetical protein